MFRLDALYHAAEALTLPLDEDAIIRRKITLLCDVCEAPLHGAAVAIEDAGPHLMLRRLAAKLGWGTRQMGEGDGAWTEDLCPVCLAAHNGVASAQAEQWKPMPLLRTQEDIFRAHGMLEMLRSGVLNVDIPEDALERLTGSSMALCWLLHGGSGFGALLQNLESMLNANGALIHVATIPRAPVPEPSRIIIPGGDRNKSGH